LDTLALSPDGRRLGVGVGDRVSVPDAAELAAQALIHDGRRMGLGRGDRSPPLRREHIQGGLVSFDVLAQAVLETHEGDVGAAAYSPDGALLAVSAGNQAVVRGAGEMYRVGGDRGPVCALTFSPDGARLALAHLGGAVVLWDLKTRKSAGAVGELHEGGFGAEVAVDAEGAVVEGVVPGGAAARDGRIKKGDRIPAIGDADGTMVPTRGMTLEEFVGLGRGRAGDVVKLEVRPAQGGATLALELTRQYLDIVGPQRLVFSPDGRRLAAVGGSGSLVWDLTAPGGGAWAAGVGGAVTFSPDGRRLLGAGRGGQVIVADAASGRRLAALSTPLDAIGALALTRDGSLALAGRKGADLTWALLDVTPLEERPARSEERAGREAAIRALTVALATPPEDRKALARLYHQRGLLRGEIEDFAAARQDLDRAFELDPTLADPPKGK
jgi:WD40 repeat protein